MSAIDAVQLAIEVTLLALLWFMFLKSYFGEKGKNLATKEDVAEITSLVESVKSQLQFFLQAKLSLRAEEHQALVDYFSKYSAWLSAITNFSIAGIHRDNTFQLSEIRSQLDAHKRDVELAAGKMQLFVENEHIRSRHGTLMIETLKFQGHAQQLTLNIERLHLESKQMELSIPPHEQVQRYKELLEKEMKLYQQFNDEQLQMYKALYPLVQEQRRAISAHIKALGGG